MFLTGFDETEEQKIFENVLGFVFMSWWNYADIMFELIWLLLSLLICIGYSVADGICGRKKACVHKMSETV